MSPLQQITATAGMFAFMFSLAYDRTPAHIIAFVLFAVIVGNECIKALADEHHNTKR